MVAETVVVEKITVGDTQHKPERLVTADEFWEMSFPNERSELVNGKVIRMAPASGGHGIYAIEIGSVLHSHVKKKKLGVVCAAETGFVLSETTVRAPDAAFISHQRLEEHRSELGGQIHYEKFWPFAPDLAVEVVSPGDRAKDIKAKIRDWFEGGARMVWIVYPSSHSIHVLTSPTDVQILEEKDTLSGGDVVPGFSCPVAAIFEG